MVKKISDCVGCETCIGCGLKNEYNAMFCDKCKSEIPMDDRVYFVDGLDLCMDCALDTLDCAIVTEDALYE